MRACVRVCVCMCVCEYVWYSSVYMNHSFSFHLSYRSHFPSIVDMPTPPSLLVKSVYVQDIVPETQPSPHKPVLETTAAEAYINSLLVRRYIFSHSMYSACGPLQSLDCGPVTWSVGIFPFCFLPHSLLCFSCVPLQCHLHCMCTTHVGMCRHVQKVMHFGICFGIYAGCMQ